MSNAKTNLRSRIKSPFQFKEVDRILRIMSKRDRARVIQSAVIQSALNFLDLIGVAAIGVLGALSVRGVQSAPTNESLNNVLKLIHLNHFDFQIQIAVLACSAGTLLVGRTVLTMIFSRKLLGLLSRCSSDLATSISRRYFALDISEIRKYSPQDVLYSITSGTDAIMIRFLGTTIAIASDSVLLLLLSFSLFLVSPIVAISTILTFSFVAVTLYLLTRKKAEKVSYENAKLRIEIAEDFLETRNSVREISVQDRLGNFVSELNMKRRKVASSSAELTFMPSISRYSLEITVVLGAVLVGASEFLLGNAAHAVANLSIFMAAGLRIAPAVLRLQQGAVQVKASGGESIPTLELLERLEKFELDETSHQTCAFSYPDFVPSVNLRKVTFQHPRASAPIFSEFSLFIPANSSVAIVGPSGAGKSSLIDLMLGLTKPSSGEISISDIPARNTWQKWPGAISYVPQEVFICQGSIKENVGYGYKNSEIDLDRVKEALKLAGLSEFIYGLPGGIDEVIGDQGIRLSGGQQQRLGLARALYTNPSLIVLDEATSALDAVTELEISETLQNLRGKATVICIAHRLSTVRNVDTVIYLDSGRIIAEGTFEYVRSAVPDFDKNAKLLGM